MEVLDPRDELLAGEVDQDDLAALAAWKKGWTLEKTGHTASKYCKVSFLGVKIKTRNLAVTEKYKYIFIIFILVYIIF